MGYDNTEPQAVQPTLRSAQVTVCGEQILVPCILKYPLGRISVDCPIMHTVLAQLHAWVRLGF